MKKLVFVFALIFPIYICAQKKLTRQEKKYLKLAQQLDILDYLPDTTDYNPSTFWNCVVQNNAPLQEELAKFKNPRGLAKQACEEVEKRRSVGLILNRTYDPNTEDDLNDILRKDLIGHNCSVGNVTFRLWVDDDINAFCTPDGWIYLNTGLSKRIINDFNMTLGVLAHEVAHYMFKHMLIHEHMALKRQRENSITAAVAIMGIATANAVAASKGAMIDSETASDNYQRIADGANELSVAFRYRYGRENELMADIAAYRFLEYTGNNPEAYIKVLEMLGELWLGDTTDRYDDHPSPQDRIGVLRALVPAYRRFNEEATSTDTE